MCKGYSELKRICSCESWGDPNKEPRKYRDGKPLWSDLGTPDIGGYQINLDYHGQEVIDLDLDVVHSLADNVAYAKRLYDHEGSLDLVPGLLESEEIGGGILSSAAY